MKKIVSILCILTLISVGLFAADKKSLKSFTTYDLDGNVVTQDIFSKADVTVLNAWGTFCGPCINEMPELGKWSESMPKNVQLVGLVVDVNSTKDSKGISLARKILDRTGAHFVNLIASKNFAEFLQDVQFVPTTFLIDGKGNIIGEPIVGARVELYKQAVEKYLNGKKN